MCKRKGGVAKTTTIKNLAIGLAARGKKVLAIDLDPSANLTTALGIHVTKEQKTISRHFLNCLKIVRMFRRLCNHAA